MGEIGAAQAKSQYNHQYGAPELGELLSRLAEAEIKHNAENQFILRTFMQIGLLAYIPTGPGAFLTPIDIPLCQHWLQLPLRKCPPAAGIADQWQQNWCQVH